MNRSATAANVREWARLRNIPVGERGHISQDVIDKYNDRNSRNPFQNSNPALR